MHFLFGIQANNDSVSHFDFKDKCLKLDFTVSEKLFVKYKCKDAILDCYILDTSRDV